MAVTNLAAPIRTPFWDERTGGLSKPWIDYFHAVAAATTGTTAGGTTWYVGSVAPTTLHTDGDFYLNATTGQFYEQVSSAWVLKGSLAGPAGPAGSNGTNGTNGVGVPVGGTAGQVLAKNSSTDYDTVWITISAGGANFANNETPSGATGTSFTLANPPSPAASLILVQQLPSFGAVTLISGTDYTISGSTITTTSSVTTGTLRAWYQY